MERIKTNSSKSPENELDKLSATKKMEAILALFGTDATRDAFVKSCKQYIEARDLANVESYAPDSATRRRTITSSPKQSIIHNKIMDTLTRLASQAPTISPLQAEVLREMHDRNITAQIIRKYLESTRAVVVEDDDEDEMKEEKERGGMSDTAYYHFLGKGH